MGTHPVAGGEGCRAWPEYTSVSPTETAPSPPGCGTAGRMRAGQAFLLRRRRKRGKEQRWAVPGSPPEPSRAVDATFCSCTAAMRTFVSSRVPGCFGIIGSDEMKPRSGRAVPHRGANTAHKQWKRAGTEAEECTATPKMTGGTESEVILDTGCKFLFARP